MKDEFAVFIRPAGVIVDFSDELVMFIFKLIISSRDQNINNIKYNAI